MQRLSSSENDGTRPSTFGWELKRYGQVVVGNCVPHCEAQPLAPPSTTQMVLDRREPFLSPITQALVTLLILRIHLAVHFQGPALIS